MPELVTSIDVDAPRPVVRATLVNFSPARRGSSPPGAPNFEAMNDALKRRVGEDARG